MTHSHHRMALVLCAVLLALGASACSRNNATLLRVHASATTRATPDLAIVTFGVSARGATARAAQDAQARKMTAVLAAAQNAGVTAENVQTVALSLNPEYVYPRNASPRVSGYNSTNTVSVRVEKLDTVSTLVDAVVADGANALQGIQFAFKDDDAARNTARAQAVAAAQARANAYAAAAHMRVDRIVSISEDGADLAPPTPLVVQDIGMLAERAAPTPIRAGQLDAEGGVSVVFALR